MRRILWRNERFLYRRKCDFCKKDIISIYGSSAPFPVYCPECWWLDSWSPLDYGQDYDFSASFFTQFKKLQDKVPHIALNVVNNKNSSYVNNAWNSNNSYMCFDLGYGENMSYCKAVHYSKDSVDCSYCKKIELCYDNLDSQECTSSDTLENCKGCHDSYFLKDCKNCLSCILCTNLRSKSYYILNEPHTKEEFERLKPEYIGGSFEKREKTRKLFGELKSKAIHRANENIQTVNSSGNNLWQCKDCKNSFSVFRSENIAFCHDIDSDVKDSMDLSHAAEGELMYDSTSASGTNIKFSWFTANSFNVQYSTHSAKASSNLFGCVGVASKQYCILNKQYAKEDYETLLSKIVEHMNSMPYTDRKGRVFKYGEFFPPELSPFGYNETTAQENFRKTREKILSSGFNWREPEEKTYLPKLQAEELPDDIAEISDEIVNEVISCAHHGKCNDRCTTAFKIVQQELQFYRRMKIPLPRFCFNCRYYERLAKRNPMKLWHRKCTCGGVQSENGVYKNTIAHSHGTEQCPNEFKTSYALKRPEIVYCESCYQQEVA